ncbi:MAG: adenylate/guanylate cyclase domain-containing protein [Deltaproteobacteria bacterium]|nr:adenylate/guanylate cyclase domain-containing protein [Deltaproteobacteria bacterium]
MTAVAHFLTMADDQTTNPHSDPAVELELLRERERLNAAIDGVLECALRQHMSLEKALDQVFPILGEFLGAGAALVRTYDESLALADFCWREDERGDFPLDAERICQQLDEQRSLALTQDDWCALAQRVEVAGERFGTAAVAWRDRIDRRDSERNRALLRVWCEQVDNYLASIAMARRKHQAETALAEALKNPVLGEGIEAATEVLKQTIDFDDLVLVYRYEDDPDGSTLAYRIIKDREVVYDTITHRDSDIDAFMREHRLDILLRGDHACLAQRFGLEHFHEEVLISGMRRAQIVGRLLVSSRGGSEFCTYDRDLLQRFADFLRLRIVDFNREWRHLALCFPRDTVRRLMGEKNYVERYLRPRVRDVAILYCDIVGFTRVSEQVLRSPALIGRLIDSWSDRVVEMIWASGGVFDKMVGDCIIGLWGPPFFELSPDEACARAARAAIEIRDFTHTLSAMRELPELASQEQPLAVATGLNYSPLFVGRFGPNEGYTGFSSGMNNAARLQGVATRDEILCMDTFVDALGGRARFGDVREATVKNVAAPIKFRPLIELVERP